MLRHRGPALAAVEGTTLHRRGSALVETAAVVPLYMGSAAAAVLRCRGAAGPPAPSAAQSAFAWRRSPPLPNVERGVAAPIAEKEVAAAAAAAAQGRIRLAWVTVAARRDAVVATEARRPKAQIVVAAAAVAVTVAMQYMDCSAASNVSPVMQS